VLFDIELVWRNGGMRILLMTLTEGPADVAPEIAMALLTVVDRPRTRVFLDGGVDLEVFPGFYWVPRIILISISPHQMALAAFTDAYGKGSGNADRMRASSKVITIMLRNWSGESNTECSLFGFLIDFVLGTMLAQV
jgi:rapamycin-insensitive companion of mTOR